MEDAGMRMMTAVRGGALLTTPAGRGRVTVSMTQTVRTQGGRCVVTTSASTPSISPQQITPTTPPGLASHQVTTAATENVTRTITGVVMAMWAVCTMRTALMVTTTRLT